MSKDLDIAAMRVGEHLKSAIDKTPYTQAMIAGELNIDQKTLWRYLSGNQRAPREVIAAIAKTCKDDKLEHRCAFEENFFYDIGIKPDYEAVIDIKEGLAESLPASLQRISSLIKLINKGNKLTTEDIDYVTDQARKEITGWWEILACQNKEDTA